MLCLCLWREWWWFIKNVFCKKYSTLTDLLLSVFPPPSTHTPTQPTHHHHAYSLALEFDLDAYFPRLVEFFVIVVCGKNIYQTPGNFQWSTRNNKTNKGLWMDKCLHLKGVVFCLCCMKWNSRTPFLGRWYQQYQKQKDPFSVLSPTLILHHNKIKKSKPGMEILFKFLRIFFSPPKFDFKREIRCGVVGNITACHAVAPGSIPGTGALFWHDF